MAGPRTKRGKLTLALAAAGGAVLVLSAVSPWVQPARVFWPSYTDGVFDPISHPSDGLFRLVAAVLGGAALVLVALVRRGSVHQRLLAALAPIGLVALAVGAVAYEAVTGYHGFGSRAINDMTIAGFHHGALNYLELAGAALLVLAPLPALRRR